MYFGAKLYIIKQDVKNYIQEGFIYLPFNMSRFLTYKLFCTI